MTNNVDIKEFSINEASKIFDKLSKFYNKEEIDIWKLKVLKDINTLFYKYKVTNYELNANSYMGIVLECNSIEKGVIYIKIVPPMINRYLTEINTLKLLPKDLTCKIYENDFDKNAIVMEKINPGYIAEFYSNQDEYRALFHKMYTNRIKLTTSLRKEFKDFIDVVEHDYNIYVRNNGHNELVDELYIKFKNIYHEIIKDEEEFLLHGDVYKNNAIMSISGIKIIDPLGFIAPFVMELLPICAYEMLNNPKNNVDIFNDFSIYFSEYVDSTLYKKALFCQLVKVYIPSLYEANDGGLRASKWLEIIKELYGERMEA